MMERIRISMLVAALCAVPVAASGQVLSLGEALRRAESSGYANRMAAGRAVERSAQEQASLRGILPSLRLDGGYVQTTDPVGVFGIALRQRRIEPADFDPAKLNDPAATKNYTGAVVVEQPLVNVDAHLGRRAAAHASAAGRASEQWTRIGTRVEVIQAYYGAILAREQVATLEAGSVAAHAHVRQARALVTHGLATNSDALLAAVKAGEVDVRLLEARGAADLARRQLAVVLGAPEDTAFALPAQLPETDRIRALAGTAESRGVGVRADVVAAREGLESARMDEKRARSTFLPRLNGLARYDWNSPDFPYRGERNWTIGVIASWSPFAGGAQLADARAARGRAEAARAGAEAAQARAALEVERAETAWSVALARLETAEAAVRQSAEVHRIVGRKYDGGLATILELVSAAATETESSLGLSSARYGAIMAAAERLQAPGQDPALLVILENEESER